MVFSEKLTLNYVLEKAPKINYLSQQQQQQKNPFSVFKFYKIVPYLKLEFLITKYLSLKKAKK